MGGGASSQAKQARAGYEPPALRRPSIVQLAKKNRVPYQLMEIVDKRFHQLDKRCVVALGSVKPRRSWHHGN